MPTLAYLECPTGIAGDMCLGALVHAGVPLAYLTEQLHRLGIANEYQLRTEKVLRNGIQATKVHVDLTADWAVDLAVDLATVEHGAIASPSPHAHSHPHSHPHPHEHSHAHPHAHEHSHAHPHSHPHSHAHPHPDKHPHEHPHAHPHSHPPTTRHLPDIERLIQAAALPPRAEAWSLAVFRQLAVAEGAVHGIAPEQVHFHEVGATDAIVDIVGTCLGLDWLGIDRLYCSALPTGGGTVWAAHGRLPVPTPAVLNLWELRQVPIYSNGINRELVTPTGAAIATTLAVEFGPPPPMTLQRVGLGAGSHELPIPNMLRLWLGTSPAEGHKPSAVHASSTGTAAIPGITPTPAAPSPLSNPPEPCDRSITESEPGLETITVLETQIDDLTPQAIGYAFERLFEAGALDVFTQAVGMKKSRSGILLTVVCHPAQSQACQTVLFQETTTLGIRHMTQQRIALDRAIQTVSTVYGDIRVKVGRWPEGGAIANVQPEYEDCAQIARTYKLPWLEVQQLALRQWHAANGTALAAD